MKSAIIIFVQLSILLATSLGFGYLLSRTLKDTKKFGADPESRLIYCVTGLVIAIAVLQNLIYFNIPACYSSWLSLIISLIGVYCLAKDNTISKKSIFRNRGALPLLLGIFALQGVGLINHGPNNYYGKGHTDQVNYTLLSQFLIEKKMSMTLADVKLDPWLVKAIDLKDMRIGQSVAQAYVGVTSLTDAKQAYGTTSVFFIALIAPFCYYLSRRFGLNKRLAILSAIWVCLLPSITRIHLDGFFSQATVVFVFPALLLIELCSLKAKSKLACSGILIGWVLIAYTEPYIIALAMYFGMLLTCANYSINGKFARLVAATMLPFLLVPAYALQFYSFMLNQYQVASNPEALADLAPYAGTLMGWTKSLVNLPAIKILSMENFHRIETIIGATSVFLIFCGLLSQNLKKRRIYIGFTLPAASVLLVLGSAPVLSKYPFLKIHDSVAPIAAILIYIGVTRALILISGNKILTRPLLLGFGIIAIIASGHASYLQMKGVVQNKGILATINSPQASRIYGEVARNKRIYNIIDEHNIATAWLAYHARDSEVYIKSDYVSDRPLGNQNFIFARQPSDMVKAWRLSSTSLIDPLNYNGPPELTVKNPQGVDSDSNLTWYWVGDIIFFNVHVFKAPLSTTSRFKICMDAIAGPANPDLKRTISLLSQNQPDQVISFTQSDKLRFYVDLKKGDNLLSLKVLAPTEQMVKIKNDARNHMLRLQNITISECIDSIDTSVDLIIQNPQGADSDAKSTWYWVNKEIKFKVNLLSGNSVNEQRFILSLNASAGLANPNPMRAIRLTAENHKDQELSFMTAKKIFFEVNLKPGENVLTLYVVSPLEQIIKINGDSRVHMLRIENIEIHKLSADPSLGIDIKFDKS